jgi:hypothetical protein
MNATQHRPPARLADLSPFYIPVEAGERLPRIRDAQCREFDKGAAQSDSGFGCVDWYQYQVVEQSRLTNA